MLLFRLGVGSSVTRGSSNGDHTREITPRILMRYIESCGWEREKFGREDLIKFKSPGPIRGTKEPAVILIPSTEEVFDYNKIVNIALRRISAFEGRSSEELLEQLSVVSDSIEVKIFTLDPQRGVVPIRDGISLYQSLRDLLIFSVCSELDPSQKAFPRKLREAAEIVKACFIGQSQSGGSGANVHGGFLATVHLPLPKRYELAVDGEIIDPILRRSILRILRGLRDVELSVDLKDPGPMTENSSRGLNSNMCNVLMDIIEVGGGTDLSISATLDPMYAVPGDVITDLKLSPSSKTYLETAASILEEDPPEGFVELMGYVTQLKCDAEKGGGDMEIRMKAFGIEGHDAIPVKVLLDEKSYQLAIDAHKYHNKIQINGTLEKTGRGWTLNRPKRLEVIDRGFRGSRYKSLDSF